MNLSELITKQIRTLTYVTGVAFIGGHTLAYSINENKKFLLPEDHIHQEAPAQRPTASLLFTFVISGTSPAGTTTTTTTP